MMVWLWVGFIALVLVLLALDLGVFNRKAHVIGANEAMLWTCIWIVFALGFNVLVYKIYDENLFNIATSFGHNLTGKEAAVTFLTGYLIEKSLSLDNIFVIAIIFGFFAVPPIYQHRVLFWGVLGALVMRGLMIGLGTALIQRFTWITYALGGFLIITAIKMFFTQEDSIHPDQNIFVRLARRVYPVSSHYDGPRFFTQFNGKRAITPLFLVLLVVESTDLMFAVDSIPAIFAITQDPFIVFTSNVFAILGLRSLYFVLARVLDRFRYLKVSLVVILAFVGTKMLLAHTYKLDHVVSLLVVIGIIGVGILASIMAPRPEPAAAPEGPVPVPEEAPQMPDEEISSLMLTWRRMRRIVIFLIGSTIVLIGIALLVLPGPATLVIPLGLAVLGSEFLWARKLLKIFKERAASLARTIMGTRTPDTPK